MKTTLKNTHGFTLIEILVTLLIASIVMIMGGSIILNSMGYFSKTTVSDNDKQAVDGIATLLRSEIVFASEVKLVPKADGEKLKQSDGWNHIYVDRGRLFFNDSELYNEAYYHQRTLSFKVRGFDSFRMDMKLAYVDTKNEDVYRTAFTLELLNLKVIKDKQDSTFDAFKNNSSLVTIEKNGYWLCYRKGELGVKQTDNYSGTVADEINCKTEANDMKTFVLGKDYKIGDFVEFPAKSNVWYRATYDMPTCYYSPNSNTMWWKKIVADFDANSTYYKGDIVKSNNGLYYQVEGKFANTGHPPETNRNTWSDGYKTLEGLLKKSEIRPDCSLGGTVKEGE